MIKTLLAASALSLGVISAVQAADLVIMQPQPMATYAPSFSWTGFYVGGNIGYGWGHTDVNGGGIALGRDPRGVAGGVQAGYNYDFGGFVLGAEADFSLSDINSSDAVVGTVRVENFGSVRARAGYAVDRFMPYVTGGFAYGTVNFSAPATPPGSERQTHTGWTIGAGAEYAFTDNIVARAEYLYTDLGSKNYFGGTIPGGVNADIDFGTVRTGVSFKF